MAQDSSPIDELAALLRGAAENDTQRAALAPWLRERHDDFGGMAMLPALPALWASALAETHAQNFEEDGPPYFLRNHDLSEWVCVLDREDAPAQAGAAVQRFRWHQFSDEEMVRAVRLATNADQIAQKLGITSIRGQWDAWVFEDFLFTLPDGVQCVLTHKMVRSSGESEGFCLEVEAPAAGAATKACLALLGLALEDADWVNEDLLGQLQ